MGDTKSVGFDLDQEFVDQLDREADKIGLSRAEYLRQRIQAGRLVISAGQVDTDTLSELVEEGIESAELGNNDINHKHRDGLTDVVLEKLPSDKTRAISKDEVRELVFGTQDEQRKKIDEAISNLYEADEIDHAVNGGGYYVD